MSICIFPGTFNPIHIGHIKMAEFALGKYDFDKIIFIPSYLPPHKILEKDLASHRYNMVRLITDENPKFDISDIEYKSDGKSYSLITVRKLIEQYSLNERLNFIIGTDAFEKLNTWYHADELKALVHFIVFPRKGDDINKICKKASDEGWDFEVVSMDYVDVSSTEIRNGEYKEGIKKVEEYIEKHGLYKN